MASFGSDGVGRVSDVLGGTMMLGRWHASLFVAFCRLLDI